MHDSKMTGNDNDNLKRVKEPRAFKKGFSGLHGCPELGRCLSSSNRGALVYNSVHEKSVRREAQQSWAATQFFVASCETMLFISTRRRCTTGESLRWPLQSGFPSKQIVLNHRV